MTPTLNPCRCGDTPTLTERAEDGNQILRVVCGCGNAGGSVFYRKPEDANRTRQAAADGWNLAACS